MIEFGNNWSLPFQRIASPDAEGLDLVSLPLTIPMPSKDTVVQIAASARVPRELLVASDDPRLRPPTPLWTVKTAYRRTGVPKRTLRLWARKGLIDASRAVSGWVINRASLLAYLDVQIQGRPRVPWRTRQQYANQRRHYNVVDLGKPKARTTRANPADRKRLPDA